MAGAELELVPPQLLPLCTLWSQLLCRRAAKPWLSQESAASRGCSSWMVGGVPSCKEAFSMAEGADSACESPAHAQARAFLTALVTASRGEPREPAGGSDNSP